MINPSQKLTVSSSFLKKMFLISIYIQFPPFCCYIHNELPQTGLFYYDCWLMDSAEKWECFIYLSYLTKNVCNVYKALRMCKILSGWACIQPWMSLFSFQRTTICSGSKELELITSASTIKDVSLSSKEIWYRETLQQLHWCPVMYQMMSNTVNIFMTFFFIAK